MDSFTAPLVILCPLLTVVTLGYLLTCVLWPFGPCRTCDGTGKRRAPFGRAFRDCTRCKGTGRRLRTGRKLHNHLTRMRRNGTR
ncbi:hypothetical protein [Catellatospora tritici]|uniref:hypothetical protein n=1 Tax=Catellatospora tritici TaxID=2851566 RepID=UPI001C2D824C|nr:hypothetical protein [Catellatospora tritici]MBV1851901.1 hypothetical protein [Catellatospora tritici]